MLKKPITYTDYNGKVITENFHFNLSTAELIKLEMSTMTLSEDMASTTGGLQEHIQAVIDSRSGKRIVEMFDMFVDASFGVRSEDGRKFVKNDEVLQDFKATPAYDVVFMELVTDADAGARFINGIMPAEALAEAARAKASQDVPTPAFGLPITDNSNLMPADVAPTFPNENANQKAARKGRMTKEEILAGMRRKSYAGRVLTELDVLEMSQEELDHALENGSTVEGL